MKKGISLIVLVITIIVMIIIAGAIIISLNSSNVIQQANKAVADSDAANVRNALMLAYAEHSAENNGIAMKDENNVMTAADYAAYLADNGIIAEADETAYAAIIEVNPNTGIPKLTGSVNKIATNG